MFAINANFAAFFYLIYFCFLVQVTHNVFEVFVGSFLSVRLSTQCYRLDMLPYVVKIDLWSNIYFS